MTLEYDREYQRRWRQENPDGVKERNRKNYVKHREAHQDRKRKYQRTVRESRPLWSTHSSMMARCNYPSHSAYKNYGGRGISIYPAWRGSEGYESFERWIMDNLGPRPEGMSLDRIDNDGNYEPGNLRWSTRSEQAANKRTSRRGD